MSTSSNDPTQRPAILWTARVLLILWVAFIVYYNFASGNEADAMIFRILPWLNPEAA